MRPVLVFRALGRMALAFRESCTVSKSTDREEYVGRIGVGDVLNTLLRPVQIPLHLLSGLHAVGEIRTRAFKASLSERLQFEEFTVFGVEFAGSVHRIGSVGLWSLKNGKGTLRLRLPRQSPIQGKRVEGAVQAVTEHLDEIDAVSAGGGRFVFAARAAAVAAGGGGVAVGRGGGGVRAGAGD